MKKTEKTWFVEEGFYNLKVIVLEYNGNNYIIFESTNGYGEEKHMEAAIMKIVDNAIKSVRMDSHKLMEIATSLGYEKPGVLQTTCWEYHFTEYPTDLREAKEILEFIRDEAGIPIDVEKHFQLLLDYKDANVAWRHSPVLD